VGVQLVRVKDGTPLWAGRFDATSTDIFKVQDSISEQAAKALLGKLTGEDEKRLTKRYTDNAEAYQLYLQGRYHYNRSTEESLKKAIDYYNKAIETDQGYALAYAGLSIAYNALGYGGWARFEDVVEKQKWNAEKAIAIDDTLAEAHLALAIYLENQWEWQASEEEYRRAIALNPNFAHTWLELSGFLLKPRRWDEAVSDAKRALELEPASYFVNTHMAFIYYMTGRFKESIAAMRKAQEFAPNPDEERRLVDCRMHELETNYAEAIKCLQSLTPHDQPEARPSLRLAILYAKSGNEKESRKLIAEAISKSQRQHVESSRVAAAFAALHDNDRAFAWLEKACDSRDPALPYVNSDPAYDNLRPDPRWTSLIQRMGLQP
jgi:tetratricopeptide (TPR) repeat protein